MSFLPNVLKYLDEALDNITDRYGEGGDESRSASGSSGQGTAAEEKSSAVAGVPRAANESFINGDAVLTDDGSENAAHRHTTEGSSTQNHHAEWSTASRAAGFSSGAGDAATPENSPARSATASGLRRWHSPSNQKREGVGVPPAYPAPHPATQVNVTTAAVSKPDAPLIQSSTSLRTDERCYPSGGSIAHPSGDRLAAYQRRGQPAGPAPREPCSPGARRVPTVESGSLLLRQGSMVKLVKEALANKLQEQQEEKEQLQRAEEQEQERSRRIDEDGERERLEKLGMEKEQQAKHEGERVKLLLQRLEEERLRIYEEAERKRLVQQEAEKPEQIRLVQHEVEQAERHRLVQQEAEEAKRKRLAQQEDEEEEERRRQRCLAEEQDRQRREEERLAAEEASRRKLLHLEEEERERERLLALERERQKEEERLAVLAAESTAAEEEKEKEQRELQRLAREAEERDEHRRLALERDRHRVQQQQLTDKLAEERNAMIASRETMPTSVPAPSTDTTRLTASLGHQQPVVSNKATGAVAFGADSPAIGSNLDTQADTPARGAVPDDYVANRVENAARKPPATDRDRAREEAWATARMLAEEKTRAQAMQTASTRENSVGGSVSFGREMRHSVGGTGTTALSGHGGEERACDASAEGGGSQLGTVADEEQKTARDESRPTETRSVGLWGALVGGRQKGRVVAPSESSAVSSQVPGTK